MTRLRIRHLLVVTGLAAALVLTGCHKHHDESSHSHNHDSEHASHQHADGDEDHEELPEDIVELSEDQITQAGIAYGAIEQRSMGRSIRVNGSIQALPQAMASVCMPFGGFVKTANLLPGANVRKGQVLATIENPEFVDLQQDYLVLKHKFTYLENEYQRHQSLYKDDVYSRKNVQEATAEYLSLKAQMRGLEQKLTVLGINPQALNEDNISAVLPLRAPISGNIATSAINIGKYVSPTDVLFTISNPSQLMLELTLFENDARSVAPGAAVRFTVNNETHEHTAVVYQVGSSISATHTYTAFATVRPPCPNLLPGMYVNASIGQGDKASYVVPEESVVLFNDISYVFVHERDKEEHGQPFTEYRFVRVQAGASREGMTEVIPLDDVNLNGARLVVKGAYTLLSAKKNAGDMTCG